MKLFRVQLMHSDTCGNTWADNLAYYVEAETEADVLKVFPQHHGLGGWNVLQVSILTLDEAHRDFVARAAKQLKRMR